MCLDRSPLFFKIEHKETVTDFFDAEFSRNLLFSLLFVFCFFRCLRERPEQAIKEANNAPSNLNHLTSIWHPSPGPSSREGGNHANRQAKKKELKPAIKQDNKQETHE